MRVAPLLLALAFAGCASHRPPPPAPAPVTGAPPDTTATAAPETVTVRDPALEREATRLRMTLLERTAQLADANRRLDEATTEVVRQMARLRSLASRAEAASAIAEAEVTLQQLRGAGPQGAADVRQAEQALRAASAAFDAENFGGAVYLATQAKRAATAGRGRLAEGGTAARAGERAFAVPVGLVTTARANLRGAPAGGADVVATVAAGTPLTAYAWVQDWIRVALADGRGGWVHQSVVRGVAGSGP